MLIGWALVTLDVTDAAAVLTAGVDRFGRIDVVVENAGYVNVAPVETTSSEDFRRQFETSFEPGGFATDWAGASMELLEVSQEYRQTVGAFAVRIREAGGGFVAGGPVCAADILVRVARRDRLPSHFLIAAGAAESAIRYSQAQTAEATAWRAVSGSADFGAEYPVGFPTGDRR